jgi:hypothetical protein
MIEKFVEPSPEGPFADFIVGIGGSVIFDTGMTAASFGFYKCHAVIERLPDDKLRFTHKLAKQPIELPYNEVYVIGVREGLPVGVNDFYGTSLQRAELTNEGFGVKVANNNGKPEIIVFDLATKDIIPLSFEEVALPPLNSIRIRLDR